MFHSHQNIYKIYVRPWLCMMRTMLNLCNCWLCLTKYIMTDCRHQNRNLLEFLLHLKQWHNHILSIVVNEQVALWTDQVALPSQSDKTFYATVFIKVLIQMWHRGPKPVVFDFFYWIILYTAFTSKYFLQYQNILFLTEVMLICLEQSKKWKKRIKSLTFFVSS